MFDDVAGLFYENVLASYANYVEQRDKSTSGRSKLTRTAIEAATALFHFREHMPTLDRLTRSEVVARCADYRLVADTANAAKHRKLTKKTSEGWPLVRSANSIFESTIVTLFSDDLGEYSDAQTFVFVKCTDGHQRNLDSALTNVLNFWGSELLRLSIIKEFPLRKLREIPGSRLIDRTEARAMDLEILAGVRMKKNIQLQRFDASKGYAEPVDLTGHKAEFRVYQPRYEVTLTLEPPDGSEEIAVPIELTTEQHAKLHTLTTDAERKAYIDSIVDEQADRVRLHVDQVLKSRRQACT